MHVHTVNASALLKASETHKHTQSWVGEIVGVSSCVERGCKCRGQSSKCVGQAGAQSEHERLSRDGFGSARAPQGHG